MSSEKVLGDDVILTTPLLRSSQPLSSAEIFQSLVIIREVLILTLKRGLFLDIYRDDIE